MEQLSYRKKWKNNIRLQGNGEVFAGAGLSQPLWELYKKDLEKVVLKHKWCFPDYEEGKASFETMGYKAGYRKEEYYIDAWGCKWFKVDGYDVGQIVSHPLADQSKFADYCPPNLLITDEWGNPQDWEAFRRNIEEARRNDTILTNDFGIRIFERPHFLMDMENMMIALAEGDPFVEKVIGLVLLQNMVLINRMLECGGPDLMGFSDDLGDQKTLLISPALWRRYFKPAYRAMFSACNVAGVLTALHSDGQNSEIFDDLVEIRLNMLNCQVSVIGIDKVAKLLKGRICISADIDRQQVMPFGTPNDVRDLVKEIVTKLGSPIGGLELSADIYPDVPLENIAAFLDTAEEYRFYWVGRG